MFIDEVKRAIESIAPVETQMEWDNSGVQICYGPREIKKILVAMEINNQVVDEALSLNADMILTHHPLFFNGVKSIHGCSSQGRQIIRLIKNDITVYSCHTPFDKAAGGNNDFILEGLGCKDLVGIDGEEPSIAKMGTLDKPTYLKTVIKKLSALLGNPGGIKYIGQPNDIIQKIAVCTGAGSEFYRAALENGAQLFITGDVSHHEACEIRDSGIDLIDAGHAGTEWVFAKNMASKLRRLLGEDTEVIESQSEQDPFDYK